MPADFHDDRLVVASLPQVSHSAPAQVMHQETFVRIPYESAFFFWFHLRSRAEFASIARLLPLHTEIRIREDLSGFRLHLTEHHNKDRRQGDHARRICFCLLFLQPDETRFQINLGPVDLTGFIHAHAAAIQECDERSEVSWQQR